MCGRFTTTAPADVLAEEFGLDAVAPAFAAPRFNVAPTHDVPVISAWAPTALEPMRWGLVPPWADTLAIGPRFINARAETVADKPAFRQAFEKRRCLVVGDGFYEWRRDGKRKIPMYVRLRSHRPWAFAGVWEGWLSPEGTLVKTCTIITTEPNELLAPIHDRMPAILDREARARWLDDTTADWAELLALLRPFPADAMEMFPVSTQVNKPDFDDPTCVERCEPPGTLTLPGF